MTPALLFFRAERPFFSGQVIGTSPSRSCQTFLLRCECASTARLPHTYRCVWKFHTRSWGQGRGLRAAAAGVPAGVGGLLRAVHRRVRGGGRPPLGPHGAERAPGKPEVGVLSVDRRGGAWTGVADFISVAEIKRKSEPQFFGFGGVDNVPATPQIIFVVLY
eukprot:EG_transcript_11199